MLAPKPVTCIFCSYYFYVSLSLPSCGFHLDYLSAFVHMLGTMFSAISLGIQFLCLSMTVYYHQYFFAFFLLGTSISYAIKSSNMID